MALSGWTSDPANACRNPEYLEGYVDSVGVETGKERALPTLSEADIRAGDRTFFVARGRNNLVALSQTQNLYFTAYGESLWVYEPLYPYQTLSNAPCAILNPPVSRANLRGYLDLDRSHDINHVIVDRFGSEEVLVTSHDDGDVVFYMIREIVRQIGELPKPRSGEPKLIEPRVFYRLNLGISAWGISLHSQNRKIALSCNDHSVTVVELATADVKQDSEHELTLDDIRQQRRDGIYRLVKHYYNIPNVSFLNGPSDPDGNYVCSIDLGGETCVWDLRDHKWPGSLSPIDSGDHQLGWGVACLDLTWFKEVTDIPAFPVNEDNSLDLSTLPIAVAHAASILESPPAFASSAPRRTTDNPTSDGIDAAIRQESSTMMYMSQGSSGQQFLARGPLKQPTPEFILLRTTTEDIALIRPKDMTFEMRLEDLFGRFSCMHLGELQSRDAERISMLKVVPELGIVLVGTQQGYVAIMSMVKFLRDEKYRYLLVLDAVVPHAHQLRKIPPRLHGFAIGPIQGREVRLDAEDHMRESWRKHEASRRYRLLLEYDDQTVLSYELCRAV